MFAPHRTVLRRAAALVLSALATLFTALAVLPAPQASASDIYYHSHVNVSLIDGGADFTGTVAESAGLMATAVPDSMGNAIKTGTVKVGPVPSYQGPQRVQVDMVLFERWLPSWTPTRIVVKSATVDFSSGAAAPDYVGGALQPIDVRANVYAANYYTVQYELHWYSDSGALLDEATILPDADQTEYQCGIAACTVTADGLHM